MRALYKDEYDSIDIKINMKCRYFIICHNVCVVVNLVGNVVGRIAITDSKEIVVRYYSNR